MEKGTWKKYDALFLKSEKGPEEWRRIVRMIRAHPIPKHSNCEKSILRAKKNPKLLRQEIIGMIESLFEIETLLKENEDLFLQSFIQIKGIKGDIGEMRTQLKLDAKVVKH